MSRSTTWAERLQLCCLEPVSLPLPTIDWPRSSRGLGHRPSPGQWEAIVDLLRHLADTANGDVADAVYVSPISAGTGKSTSLQAFASALCDDPDYADVGMVTSAIE